ncbi:MAG: AraC family transcriptional regulator [Clostridia bacterium]|nr:AraC family transcriptional regulator [Clostridia bacterium]
MGKKFDNGLNYKYIPVRNQHFLDLNPRQVGHKQCSMGEMDFQYGEVFTLIHYVSKGSGVLYKNHFSYKVKAGEAFIILPGEKASYQADKNDPWFYHWVAFDGKLSESFSSLPPVFSAPGDIFIKMEKSEEMPIMREYYLAARLFELYAALFSTEKLPNNHVRAAKKLISGRYGNSDLKISDIAEELSLDRKYLSTLFKKETGQTLQECLIITRIESAKELFEMGYGVAQAAESSGYKDISTFNRMFKKHVGMSPGQYKKTLK